MPSEVVQDVTGKSARAAGVTLGDLFMLQVARTPERIAVVDAEGGLTYEAFNWRVNRLAHGLARLGIRRGDRLGILSENRAEFVEALFAAAKLGVILATFNWRLGEAELEASIAVSTPRLILVSQRHGETLARLEHGAETVIAFGDDYEARLAAAPEDEPEAEVGIEDGILIIYTSGTTGAPKGAVISHRAEIARLNVARISYGLAGEPTALAWTPMFHVASAGPVIGALCTGGKAVLIDGADINQIHRAIREEPIG